MHSFKNPFPPRFYGRQKGRPLRPNQQALLEKRLPKIEISLPAKDTLLSPHTLFPFTPKEIWMEIGFGGGEHLTTQAFHHPSAGFIGVEVFINGIASALTQIDAKKLENIRIFPKDVRQLFKALPSNCLDRVFILFPDPWPKNRHHKRRLICTETLKILSHLLKPQGQLRIATDDPGYQEAILELLKNHPSFTYPPQWEQHMTASPADWVETRYEKKAKKKGRQSIYLTVFNTPSSSV